MGACATVLLNPGPSCGPRTRAGPAGGPTSTRRWDRWRVRPVDGRFQRSTCIGVRHVSRARPRSLRCLVLVSLAGCGGRAAGLIRRARRHRLRSRPPGGDDGLSALDKRTVGNRGPRGPLGVPGAQRPAGRLGVPGLKSDPGAPGAKGDAGTAGTKGDRGMPGAKRSRPRTAGTGCGGVGVRRDGVWCLDGGHRDRRGRNGERRVLVSSESAVSLDAESADRWPRARDQRLVDSGQQRGNPPARHRRGRSSARSCALARSWVAARSLRKTIRG
jgi:hypothetical protein